MLYMPKTSGSSTLVRLDLYYKVKPRMFNWCDPQRLYPTEGQGLGWEFQDKLKGLMVQQVSKVETDHRWIKVRLVRDGRFNWNGLFARLIQWYFIYQSGHSTFMVLIGNMVQRCASRWNNGYYYLTTNSS